MGRDRRVFVGLAIQEYKKGMQPKVAVGLGCVGLALAATLHGLNDWGDNSNYSLFVILVILASALLFLGYAGVGAQPDALQAAVQAPLKVKEEETS